ncbi:hypothetical protein M422DRAFT_173431, partial [Sphaerobolus stellatus SS14]
CIWPVIEGLFPVEHDIIVRTLIFTLAKWHALAKLRLHTESTLNALDNLTTILGRNLRTFANKTCKAWVAYELDRETASRNRRQIANSNKSKDTHAQKITKKAPTVLSKAKRTEFNLSTPKLHLLGHYVPTIRWFGATPGYSTHHVSSSNVI